MCESTDLIPIMESETLVPEIPEPETREPGFVEMVEVLAEMPTATVAATITKVVGPCPLGMMPGNSWKIGSDGKLSRPMCRPGATALSALFQMANGEAVNRSAACDCMYAGRKVTFTVREPEGELMEEPG